MPVSVTLQVLFQRLTQGFAGSLGRCGEECESFSSQLSYISDETVTPVFFVFFSLAHAFSVATSRVPNDRVQPLTSICTKPAKCP